MKSQAEGNVANLIIAVDALMSIPEKNFNINETGEAFKVSADGKCATVAGPAGWIAQHPHFKALGLRVEKVTLAGGIERPMAMFTLPAANGQPEMTVRGINALSRAIGLDFESASKVFTPSAYEGKVTAQDVAKRLRAVINKVGGRDALKAHDKALNAHAKANEKANEKAKAKKPAKGKK